MSNPEQNQVTAGLLVIGDEILSGRTQDQNIGEISQMCTSRAIELREVRIVADIEKDIVEAVNALRVRYTYVFTTGGIGPTHDDITADAIAKAFGVELPVSEEAKAVIFQKYPDTELTPSRLRMARIPVGACLILNTVTGAPGFRLENVIVMAGVPIIMRAMLDAVAPTLEGGRQIFSRSIEVGVGESKIAAGLGEVQNHYPDLKIGSYPRMGEKPVYTEVVLRGSDLDLLDEATQKVQEIVDALHRANNIDLRN